MENGCTGHKRGKELSERARGGGLKKKKGRYEVRRDKHMRDQRERQVEQKEK